LTINNGYFATGVVGRKYTPYFDDRNLQLSKLTGSFTNVLFKKDTLKAMMNIAVKERCGFELRKLKTQLKITPEIIELAKLTLLTNKTRLSNYYAMRFKHFEKDFANYETNVVMDAKFKDSKVSSDDIAYFAPDLKDWKKEVAISGRFLGTVADFAVKDLFLRSAGTTYISGDLAMKGLPYIDNTTINFTKGIIQTNQQDLAVVIPALKRLKEPNLKALGTILFRGDFNGTISNFKTNGTISSSIGAVEANVAMKFPSKAEPSYIGSLKTNQFHLGKFLNNTQIGLIDFLGKINGSSFSLSKMQTELDGSFRTLELNGYAYSNITTNGVFNKKYYNGEVKIVDPNLDFTSTIQIDMSKAEPSFNILGDIVKSNFKNLNLTKEKVELTGLIDVNFTGSNIDEFLGTAKILNANLLHENDKLSFDSLILNAAYQDSLKILTLTSNEFALTIAGKSYKLLDLPNAFQTYLNRYYPTYIAAPIAIPVKQDFKVSLFTKDFDKYIRLIDNRLHGLDYASIIGSANTGENKFEIRANIPTLSFEKYKLSDAIVIGDGSYDSLKIVGEISNIFISDSINFPFTTFNITSSNDYSNVSIQTKAENTLNEANLNAEVQTLEDGVRINFKPSSFVLNEKNWNLEKEGELVIRKYFVKAENVKFTQGFQEIKVETEIDEELNNNNLIVKLKNVVLGDLTSLVSKKNVFEGLATGEVRLNDFYGKFKASANIKAEQFRIDNDSIGLVNLKADFDSKTGEVTFNAKSPNEGYKLDVNGYYKTKDSTNQPLYISTDLSDSKINIIEKFLGDIFTEISGKATGNLIVKGNPSAPDLEGKIKLKNAGLKVNFTQVYYTIDSADITFEKDGIDFGNFIIQDKFKNKASVRGKLYEKQFTNMFFDFDMYTNKLLLIDTKAKDNKQFYGKAVGKASLSLKGPESAAKMKIIGEANDSSHIFIPNSLSKESGDADFIVFKKYGEEMQKETKKDGFDLTVDLDVTANNKVKIDVILDDLTGDVIQAQGNGRLQIVAGTTVPLTMKGRYNIEEGQYNFNFQSFIRKPFVLLPNVGNYIEWKGDPYKADIRIDAQYTAERVSVGDLLSGQQVSVSSATKSYRGKVFVIAQLRDKLTKPEINFDLDFPDNSPIKTDAVFSDFVNRIEKDQNEMLSQATSLIVFGSFAPYGQGLLSGSNSTNLNNLGVNTISQLLTKQVNKAVSNLLYKITGDKSLRFDLGTSVYSSSSIIDQSSGITANSNRLDRTNVTFKVGKSFLNDNIIVTFGADLDFNVSNSSTIANGNFQWLPDLNIEIKLSQSGRLRAIVFSKNSLDISGSTLGRRNRQGVSLSYKRDFDTFSELFATKPKDTTLQVEPPQKKAKVSGK
ncbi:MAG: translocation/assembly module TamB domain-containing protein, partial [Chitinophagaceae bacterium]